MATNIYKLNESTFVMCDRATDEPLGAFHRAADGAALLVDLMHNRQTLFKSDRTIIRQNYTPEQAEQMPIPFKCSIVETIQNSDGSRQIRISLQIYEKRLVLK